MRIYLDNCCLQRPLDDQTQPRIRVETEAVLAILAAVEARELSLLGSEVLDYEIAQMADADRQRDARAVLTLAHERLVVTPSSEALAHALVSAGIQAVDALHLALASTATADFFCTCDDQL